MKNRVIIYSVLLLVFFGKDLYSQAYTYDTFNRLTTVTYPDGSQIIYEYDELGNRVGYEVIAVKVFLDIKVMLAGPYNESSGMMNDALRAAEHLPLVEPFTDAGFQHKGAQGGGEVILSPTVLSDKGNNSIVDWVVVELRDKNDIANVLHTRSALLQRDGDVVDLDGVGLVGFFGVAEDDYYVAVRHRNHLAIATQNSIAVSSSVTTFPINFTDVNTPTYGINAQYTLPNGSLAMYSGDANGDGQVNAVDLNISWRPTNGTTFNYPTALADLNLDGSINAVDVNLFWRLNNSKATNLN